MKSRFFVISAIAWLLGMLNACGRGASQSIVPTPPPPPLQITSGALPSGITGAAYAGAAGFPLAASGGVAIGINDAGQIVGLSENGIIDP